MSPKKALSKTRESGAEGVNMKLVSEFCMTFADVDSLAQR